MSLNKLSIYLSRVPLLKLYHLFIALFFLRSIWLASPLKYPIIIVAVINLCYTDKRMEKWSVLFYSFNFIGLWYLNYYIVANHHFLLGLFTFYLTYRLWFKDDLFNYPRYIVCFVIVIATVQKLLSHYFLNGNLIGELVLSGTSFPIIAQLLDPDFAEHVAQFKTAYYGNKYLHLDLEFNTTAAQVNFIKLITYTVTAIEIVLSIILMFGKKNFRLLSLLVFLASTALFRSEFGFFSIVALIACYDAEIVNSKWRNTLVLLFGLFLLIYGNIQFLRPLVQFLGL
ncbi:MAG: hypothetical protein WBA16_09985 [Nonlabens sp.]